MRETISTAWRMSSPTVKLAIIGGLLVVLALLVFGIVRAFKSMNEAKLEAEERGRVEQRATDVQEINQAIGRAEAAEARARELEAQVLIAEAAIEAAGHRAEAALEKAKVEDERFKTEMDAIGQPVDVCARLRRVCARLNVKPEECPCS